MIAQWRVKKFWTVLLKKVTLNKFKLITVNLFKLFDFVVKLQNQHLYNGPIQRRAHREHFNCPCFFGNDCPLQVLNDREYKYASKILNIERADDLEGICACKDCNHEFLRRSF